MQYPEFAGSERGATFDFPVDSANEKSFLVCHNTNGTPKFCCLSLLKLCSIGFSLHLHSLFGNKSFSSLVHV